MQHIDIYVIWTNAPGVNFIKILCVRFSNESKLNSFSLVTFGFVIFGAKNLYEKHMCKTLMKLTPGVTKLSYSLNLFNVDVIYA